MPGYNAFIQLLVQSTTVTNMSDQIEWNFKLLAHHELAGFGGMGEGMSIQIAKDG
ncbi:MAG: hypothetical protein QOH67_2101, partial [Hyphomicrobiales bacterium]|nr:hypothetical protein [Hyphomicrobiales bacterium]